jgi:hypothetical protein
MCYLTVLNMHVRNVGIIHLHFNVQTPQNYQFVEWECQNCKHQFDFPPLDKRVLSLFM